MNKNEYVNMIQNARSWEEIKKYLFYDIKNLDVFDDKKLLSAEEQEIFERENLSLAYEDISNKNASIKNFLRFKIRYKIRFKLIMEKKITSNFDCDKTDVIKEILKRLLLPNVEKVNYNNSRQFIVNGNIKLETDTANSFSTTFNSYISHIDSDWHNKSKEYLAKNNLKQFSHELYFLKNIDEWSENLKGDDKIIFSNLELFSRLTHTIGNFVLVPIGYNFSKENSYGRSKRTNDYWDLTLRYDLLNTTKRLERENDVNYKHYKWYIDNYELFLLDCYYDENCKEKAFNSDLFIKYYENHDMEHRIPSVSIEEMNKCVETINKCIVLRGIDMLLTLNENLNNELCKIRDEIKFGKKINNIIGE